MLDYLKRFGILFFILFGFVQFNSAQRLNEDEVLFKEPPTAAFSEHFKTAFGGIANPFTENYFEPEIKSPTDVSPRNDAADVPEMGDWKFRRGEKSVGAEIGYSPFQPTFLAEKEYDTTSRSFFLANVNWSRVFGTVKGMTVQYRLEIVPVALALKNEIENPAFESIAATPNVPPTIRKNTYGIGFAPLGLRFYFMPRKRLKPFVSINGGILLFTDPMPVPETTNYSFTGDFGGGVQYQLKRNSAVSFGYRYYHISNFNTTRINPGYNANIFYVGYSFAYK